ncbi:tetratricopeptide repeat protein [Gloeomargaritales cyanobacterium VI4D9]|nr:tetratricopeptide repeat protein [Gloeomargaritales cyanobacterium VI4D9]
MKGWRLLGWMLALAVAGCAPDTNKVYEEGVLALKQGRPAEAVQKMNQVLQLRPDHLPAYEQRGIAYLKLGEYQDSVRDLTKVLEANADNPVLLRHRAIAYFALGRTEQGTADLCRAAELTKDAKVQENCANRQQAEQTPAPDNPG